MQKEDAVRVGLYIVRAPAYASRLQRTEDGLMKYLAKGSLPNDRCDSLFEPAGQIFDSLEWIARVTCHIHQKGAQTLRYDHHRILPLSGIPSQPTDSSLLPMR